MQPLTTLKDHFSLDQQQSFFELNRDFEEATNACAKLESLSTPKGQKMQERFQRTRECLAGFLSVYFGDIILTERLNQLSTNVVNNERLVQANLNYIFLKPSATNPSADIYRPDSKFGIVLPLEARFANILPVREQGVSGVAQLYMNRVSVIKLVKYETRLAKDFDCLADQGGEPRILRELVGIGYKIK